MSAPNIATLYDLESAYEDAAANYYSAITNAFLQVVTPRTTIANEDFLITPRLQVKAGIMGLGSTGSGTQETQVVTNNVPTSYYSHYQLSLQLDVVTSRSNNTQNHGYLRGLTRAGMLTIEALFNNNTVPYYQTAFVNPLSSVQGISDNDEIITQISYMLDVFIPPASWPNS